MMNNNLSEHNESLAIDEYLRDFCCIENSSSHSCAQHSEIHFKIYKFSTMTSFGTSNPDHMVTNDISLS